MTNTPVDTGVDASRSSAQDTNNQDALLPCPFCAETDVVQSTDIITCVSDALCTRCGATSRADVWNHRAGVIAAANASVPVAWKYSMGGQTFLTNTADPHTFDAPAFMPIEDVQPLYTHPLAGEQAGAVDPRAIDALKNHQRQLDDDGVEVGVSRQAVDEAVAYIERIQQPQPSERADIPFRIERRPLLVSGQLAIDPTGIVILIDSEQPEAEQEVALWHEILHLVWHAQGKEQDESAIDEIAERLAFAASPVSVPASDRAQASGRADDGQLCVLAKDLIAEAGVMEVLSKSAKYDKGERRVYAWAARELTMMANQTQLRTAASDRVQPVGDSGEVTEAMVEFVTFCADINHAYTFTDWSTFYRLRNNAIDELELRQAAERARTASTASAGDDVDQFLADVRAELVRARAKFPGDRIMTIALAEEFGELCKAVLDENAASVRKEAVQTAVMAARVVLDGDGSVREWRQERGLDQLVGASVPVAAAQKGDERK